jgi:hypothetical protein
MANRAAAGFGLIAVMISALMVAILTAVVVTIYMDSVTRDLGLSGLPAEAPAPDARARLVEAHALASSVMQALTTCVQIKGPGQSCSRDEIAGRAGLNPSTFATADGRWAVVAANLTLLPGALPSMAGQVAVSGIGGNAAGLSLALFHTGGGAVTRCNATSATPPAGPNDGQGC